MMTVYDQPGAAPTLAISARFRQVMALGFATALVLGAGPAAAQESTGIPQRSIRCNSPANPNKLYSECTTAPFSSAEEADNYGLYTMAQQRVYRAGGPGSQQGLTLWGTVAYAPKQEVNLMPWFLGGGASYQGLLPGRTQDIASLGVIYGEISKYIPDTSGETVLELNYQITLTRWLAFMPDFQYVFQPGGSSASNNTAVVGFQAVVNL